MEWNITEYNIQWARDLEDPMHVDLSNTPILQRFLTFLSRKAYPRPTA
jgi:hypothetical protein